MPSKIQKMAFVVLIFSEGFAISILSYYGCCSNASFGVVHKLCFHLLGEEGSKLRMFFLTQRKLMVTKGRGQMWFWCISLDSNQLPNLLWLLQQREPRASPKWRHQFCPECFIPSSPNLAPWTSSGLPKQSSLALCDYFSMILHVTDHSS